MIKATRIEVKKLDDRERDAERKAAWKELAEECLVATNCFWQTWWDWHIAAGSQQSIRDWHAALLKWHDSPTKERGSKPKLPVLAMSKECSNVIYHKLANEIVQRLHTRTITLLTNRLTKNLKSRKSARGSLPWWCNLLLYRERIPVSVDPQPIPYDRRNCELIPPDAGSELWKARLVLERRGKGDTIRDTVELWTAGRKRNSVRQILGRIGAGQYEMKGSMLAMDRGKWFLLISYELPELEKPALDADRHAALLPGRRDPWLLRIDGGLFYRGGFGHHIAAMRKRCAYERRERQEGYRWAGSSQRGHGRDRATASWTRLRNLWTHTCSNYNRHVAKAIVEECVRKGVGVLEYWQPCGRHVPTRFLSTAGKVDGLRESTSYPWYQMASRLSQLCQEHGVELVVRKMGDEKANTAT